MSIEVMKQALQALSRALSYDPQIARATTALRAAIEAAEKREPVLCINPKVIDPETGKVRNGIGALTYSDSPCAGWSMPLYTAQPTAQPAVPEGWKLVPVEPTQEMLDAFKHRYKEGDFWRERIHGAVAAMLAAAPEQKGGAA